MNTTYWIIIGVLTALNIACSTYLERKRKLYRRLWIAAIDRMHIDRKTASLQRDIDSKTAQHWKGIAESQLNVAEGHQRKCAKCQQELTRALESIDALMNGDTRCANGHRYYLPGTCPHCGANEAAA